MRFMSLMRLPVCRMASKSLTVESHMLLPVMLLDILRLCKLCTIMGTLYI